MKILPAPNGDTVEKCIELALGLDGATVVYAMRSAPPVVDERRARFAPQ